MIKKLFCSAAAAVMAASAFGAAGAESNAAATLNASRESRLQQLVRLIGSGDRFAARAFFAQALAPSAQSRSARLVDLISMLHDRTRGVENLRTSAAGNKVTLDFTGRLAGDPQRLVVEFAPEAPGQILRVAPAPPEPLETAVAAPANERSRIAEVDRFGSRLADAGVFSGVVLIARDGQPIYSRAFGLANAETGQKNTLETRFNIGSMNKAFTAFAVAQLVEQGKLGWDDPIGKYLPDFPDAEHASKIQVKHLLTHTSGLGNYFNDRFMAKPVSFFRDQNAYMSVAAGDPPTFEPGAKWSYSNTGFLALGFVVEKASGEGYYEYIDRHIYQPAGMRSSGSLFLDQPHERLAVPYEVEYSDAGRKLVSALDKTPVRGSSAGGGVATAMDLLRFSRAVRGNRLVSASTFKEMAAARAVLSSPLYGYGIAKERFAPPARDIIGHGGDAFGTCAIWGEIRDAKDPYTLIILSNSAMGSCHPLAARVYQLFPPQQ